MNDDGKNTFRIELSPGYMAITREFLVHESHVKTFDASEHPSSCPRFSDTAASYTICSVVVEYYEYGHYDEHLQI
jgi:hypothetical protein